MKNWSIVLNVIGCGLLAVFVVLFFGLAAFAAPDSKGTPEKPKSRADWPVERVTVIGRRGDLRTWLINHTLRGTEGFADGSAPADIGTRSEFSWQVYYMAGGKLEAHFQKLGSRVPHGPIEQLDYVDFGTWRINNDGDLCETIPRVGWGVELCYWVDRRGDRIALYYTYCGAFNRCYVGRLGPEGELVPGRAFTR